MTRHIIFRDIKDTVEYVEALKAGRKPVRLQLAKCADEELEQCLKDGWELYDLAQARKILDTLDNQTINYKS